MPRPLPTLHFQLPADGDRPDALDFHGCGRDDAHPLAVRRVAFLGRSAARLASRGLTLAVTSPLSLVAAEMLVYAFEEGG